MKKLVKFLKRNWLLSCQIGFGLFAAGGIVLIFQNQIGLIMMPVGLFVMMGAIFCKFSRDPNEASSLQEQLKRLAKAEKHPLKAIKKE